MRLTFSGRSNKNQINRKPNCDAGGEKKKRLDEEEEILNFNPGTEKEADLIVRIRSRKKLVESEK